MKVKLTLEYDGTHFAGWQAQPRQRTVQGTLEAALGRLVGQEIRVEGAGRTDAGAHALGQVASLKLETTIPSQKLVEALNPLLPDDVRVLCSEEVPEDFHARFSATGKVYRYVALLRDEQSPLSRHRAWHIGTKVDIGKIELALPLLTGTHDFRAFCAAKSSVTATVRTIREAKIATEGEFVSAEFCGNGFLYHMVRIIMGALVAVGRGKIDPQAITLALSSGCRPLAFITAPAHGLYLVAVEYGKDSEEPERRMTFASSR